VGQASSPVSILLVLVLLPDSLATDTERHGRDALLRVRQNGGTRLPASRIPMVLAATVFLENALVRFQRLIDLINRVVDMLGDPVLALDLGIIEDMGKQVAGAAELVIGQNLDFPVPVIAG
jgi:hypothetical protein